MAQKFIPQKGMLFAMRRLPEVRESIANDGTLVRIKAVTDNKEGEIFRCTGRDDRLIVAELVHAPSYLGTSNYNKPRLYEHAMWDMFPIGPEIAAALALNQCNETAIQNHLDLEKITGETTTIITNLKSTK